MPKEPLTNQGARHGARHLYPVTPAKAGVQKQVPGAMAGTHWKCLTVLILSLSLITPSNLLAKKPQKPKKTRSLDQLIQFILKEGQPGTLKAKNAVLFGLPESDTPIKDVAYSSSTTSDKREHAASVLYEGKEDEPTPQEIIWQITRSTRTPEGKFLTGQGYRLSRDGTLLNAMKIFGKVGELKQSIVPLDNESTQKDFKTEMSFWINESPNLECSKD